MILQSLHVLINKNLLFADFSESLQAPAGSVAMMQIDCQVMDTKLVHIRETAIPSFLKENSTTQQQSVMHPGGATFPWEATEHLEFSERIKAMPLFYGIQYGHFAQTQISGRLAIRKWTQSSMVIVLMQVCHLGTKCLQFFETIKAMSLSYGHPAQRLKACHKKMDLTFCGYCVDPGGATFP